MQNEYLKSIPLGQEIPNSQFAELVKAVITKGKPCRFMAKGFSMSPFIHGGDVITISPIKEKVSTGNIVILFNGQERLLVHRIIELANEMVLTKGDNSNEFDGWTTQNNILGVVSTVEHNSRSVRFGLGPERRAISWLSKKGYLQPIVKISKRVIFFRGLINE